MRRKFSFFAFVFSVSLLLALSLSWGAAPAQAKEQSKLRIVTTTTDLADVTRQIGGSRVEVSAICKGWQDPHKVETKPSYLKNLQQADGFIQTGMSLEVAYAPQLLRNAGNANIMPGKPGFFEPTAGIKVMQKPTGQVDRSQGDVHPQGNPHYTLNPTNVKLVARNITAFLKKLDPQGSAVYDQGYTNYWHKLDQADKRWKAQLQPYAGASVVTYHNSWPYFASHFNLAVVGYVEPLPGISPSIKHLNALTDLIKQKQVKVIMSEPWHPASLAQKTASQSGARLLTLPILPEGVQGTPTYIDMMNYIVNQLSGALK